MVGFADAEQCYGELGVGRYAFEYGAVEEACQQEFRGGYCKDCDLLAKLEDPLPVWIFSIESG